MRYFLLAALTIGLCLHINAQEPSSQTHRLRVPSVTEYVDGLPDLTSIVTPDSLVGVMERTLQSTADTIDAEFWWRYEGQAEAETLISLFDNLQISTRCARGSCFYTMNFGVWFAHIVRAWIRDNAIDLDAADTLTFADFTIYVEQRDFNADGQHEWLLEVTRGNEEVEQVRYLTAVVESEEYNIARVPLGGTLNWWQHAIDEWPLTEVVFEDINADGLPEWVLYWNRVSISPGFLSSTDFAVIFAWRDGQLALIGDIINYGRLENTDDDPALEVLSDVNFRDDYWGCGYSTQGQYDWDESVYAYSNSNITQFDCTARYAEDAMWAWDFETAIRLYDEYLEQNIDSYASFLDCYGTNPECTFNYLSRPVLIYYYFQARRILAHALLGNDEMVEMLLDALAAEPYQTQFAQAIINADSTDAETLCRAAYNYYAEEQPTVMEFEYNRDFHPGNDSLYTTNFSPVYYAQPIDPLRAGCDIRMFSTQPTSIPTSTTAPYPTQVPPTPDPRPQTDIWIENGNFIAAFTAGDYAAALEIAQSAEPIDDFDAVHWRYRSALAYEALGQLEAALAAYVAIYEDLPDSFWGTLAALHLEQITP